MPSLRYRCFPTKFKVSCYFIAVLLLEDWQNFSFRTVAISGLRKGSTTAEQKTESEESDSSKVDAELKEQIAKLNAEIKQLKEQNDQLLVGK